MKRLIKTFQRLTGTGQKLYEGVEERIDNEDGNIIVRKQEVIHTCPSCNQPISKEKNHVRLSCPICLQCCDFCHEARLKQEKVMFERFVLLERERLRWLESGVLDAFPGIELYRKLASLSSISRLRDIQKRLLERR